MIPAQPFVSIASKKALASTSCLNAFEFVTFARFSNLLWLLLWLLLGRRRDQLFRRVLALVILRVHLRRLVFLLGVFLAALVVLLGVFLAALVLLLLRSLGVLLRLVRRLLDALGVLVRLMRLSMLARVLRAIGGGSRGSRVLVRSVGSRSRVLVRSVGSRSRVLVGSVGPRLRRVMVRHTGALGRARRLQLDEPACEVEYCGSGADEDGKRIGIR